MAKNQKSSTPWLFITLIILALLAWITYEKVFSDNTFVQFNLRGGQAQLNNQMKITKDGKVTLNSRSETYEYILNQPQLTEFNSYLEKASLDKQYSNFAPKDSLDAFYYEFRFKNNNLTYNADTLPEDTKPLTEFLTNLANQILLTTPKSK